MLKLMILQLMTMKKWTGRKVDEKNSKVRTHTAIMLLQNNVYPNPFNLVHQSSISGSQNIIFDGIYLYSTNGSSYMTDVSSQ